MEFECTVRWCKTSLNFDTLHLVQHRCMIGIITALGALLCDRRLVDLPIWIEKLVKNNNKTVSLLIHRRHLFSIAKHPDMNDSIIVISQRFRSIFQHFYQSICNKLKKKRMKLNFLPSSARCKYEVFEAFFLLQWFIGNILGTQSRILLLFSTNFSINIGRFIKRLNSAQELTIHWFRFDQVPFWYEAMTAACSY